MDRAKLAWTVLLASFLVFCLIVTAVPTSIYLYVTNATAPRPTMMEATRGTVLVDTPKETDHIAKKAGDIKDDVPEESVIMTDPNSKAFLTLFDDSTITVFESTRVEIRESRAPRFRWGNKPNTLILHLEEGRIRIGVAPSPDAARYAEIQAQQTSTVLEEGSYTVEVYDGVIQIINHNGIAVVRDDNDEVKLSKGERATIEEDGSLVGPLPAARNLVNNGDFKYGLEGWDVYNDQGGDGGTADGEVKLEVVGDRTAARFTRTDGAGNHCTTGISQLINRDLTDFVYGKLSLDVQIMEQSLSGGGYQSSEYPLIVKLNYRDPYSETPRHWYRGFYIQNLNNNPTQNGERITSHVWLPYEVDILEDIYPPPIYITSIQIYASGWNYDSMVSSIELVVE